MSTPNFKLILEQIREAIKTVDTKTESAKSIKKQLEKALKTREAKGNIVVKANLNTNLFLINNTIENLEGGKEQLKAKLNQVVAVMKQRQAQTKPN